MGQQERRSGSKRFLPPIAWTNNLKKAGFGEKILAFILDLWGHQSRCALEKLAEEAQEKWLT